MWIVFGNKEKTERVPGGSVVQRHCEQCGETAMFYERQAVSTFQIYFIDILDYGKRTVMACGACGALYATDEVRAAEMKPSLSPVESTIGSIKNAARAAQARISSEASKLISKPGPSAAEKAPSEDTFEDPLAEEDRATEARFQELERKYRIGEP
jgi:hypothetical protein